MASTPTPTHQNHQRSQAGIAVTYLQSEGVVYLALFSALVLATWIPVLQQSFILDETGTIWAISGGAGEIIPRAIHFPQSILYCFITWAVATFAGTREVLLRLPSVIAGITSAYLIYRIGARLADKSTGALAALLWAVMPVTTEEATLTRPYMLGVLAVLSGYVVFLRWIDSPTLPRWIAWILLASLPGYFSYFYGLVFIQQMWYAIWKRTHSPARIPIWQIVSAPLCFLTAQLPLLIPMAAATKDRALHTYLGRPSPPVLVTEVIPHALAYGLVAGLFFYLLFPTVVSYCKRLPDSLWFAASWAAIPIGIMFAISRFTSTHVFTSRYMMAAHPGLALYLALVLSGFRPGSLRVLVAGISMVFAVTGFGPDPDFWHLHDHGNFRSGSAFLAKFLARRDLPVYAPSAFVEGKLLPFPVSDYDKTCLLAPLLVYPVGKPVEILPSALHRESQAYIEQFLNRVRQRKEAFLLYTGNPVDVPTWINENLRPEFTEKWLYNEGDVGIVEYDPR